MKTKILVLEDNIITLDEIEYRVSKLGYLVETCVSGKEAIAKVETFKPDLILSDINLGEGPNGIETMAIINQKNDIPVIYITAYDDDNTLSHAQITEPYAYILKPFQERDLEIAISIALYKSKTQKELRELLALKDKLFSIIAHDLREPFNFFLGITNVVMANPDHFDMAKLKSFIKMMNEASLTGYNLVNNLLQWSRSQLGGIKITKTNTNIFDFVNKLLNDQILSKTKNKNITIHTNLNKEDCAMLDSNIIELILRNIFINAIKFTPEGGQIYISSKTDYQLNKFILSIKDTGVGMDKDKINDLFKIDMNASTPGTNNEKGNGLGLVVCKDLIGKHGDKIMVMSEPNIGTTFSITLDILNK